jgi:hypothetical protein
LELLEGAMKAATFLCCAMFVASIICFDHLQAGANKEFRARLDAIERKEKSDPDDAIVYSVMGINPIQTSIVVQSEVVGGNFERLDENKTLYPVVIIDVRQNGQPVPGLL